MLTLELYLSFRLLLLCVIVAGCHELFGPYIHPLWFLFVIFLLERWHFLLFLNGLKLFESRNKSWFAHQPRDSFLLHTIWLTSMATCHPHKMALISVFVVTLIQASRLVHLSEKSFKHILLEFEKIAESLFVSCSCYKK